MSDLETLKKQVKEYETLLEMGVRLAGTLDLLRVLEVALEKAEELCRAETSSIWEVDKDEQELFFRLVRGRAAGKIRNLRIPIGEGIVGSVAASGKAEVVNEVGADPRWHGDAGDFVTRAILAIPLIAHGRVVGVIQLLNPLDQQGFTEDDLRRMTLFSGPLAHAIDNARLYAEQKRIFVDTVTAMAEAIEKRDPYTGGHVHRVVSYSLLIAGEMGLARPELEKLRMAATLHDVGKLAVPDRILSKPEPLDDDEFKIMQQHTVDGAQIVGRIRDLRDMLPGVRSHHERLDGKGYPDGLKDEELEAIPRIIAVADTYDAMTTDRPYRKGLPAQKAADEIESCAGTQLCPRVVAAFSRLYRRGDFHLQAGERVLDSLSEKLGQKATARRS